MRAIYIMGLNLIKQYDAGKIESPKTKFDSYYKNRRLTKAEYDDLVLKLAECEARKAQPETPDTPEETPAE